MLFGDTHRSRLSYLLFTPAVFWFFASNAAVVLLKSDVVLSGLSGFSYSSILLTDMLLGK